LLKVETSIVLKFYKGSVIFEFERSADRSVLGIERDEKSLSYEIFYGNLA